MTELDSQSKALQETENYCKDHEKRAETLLGSLKIPRSRECSIGLDELSVILSGSINNKSVSCLDLTLSFVMKD